MKKKASKATIQIPFPLVEAVKSRRAIVFIGAGASKEARNPAGEAPPDSIQLRDILAKRFFGREITNRDVMAVAEMAIEVAGGRSHVFEAVRAAFDGFPPSEAHKALCTFNWRMIATTNYDLLIERAYGDCRDRRQNLVRFVKDDEPVEEKLQATTNSLQYLKLHGCLEHLYDNDIPLILSREQYATYSANRTRLFGRLKDLARESTLIFIGYRLDDAHIRELIYSLTGNKRPRWYVITPDAEDFDEAFWATKNVEVLKCRFGEFMAALDDAIPPLWRSLAPSADVADFPVRKFYTVNKEESAKLRSAFETDISLVHVGMPIQEQAPKLFYEGYDVGWGGITRRLDVRRKVEEDLLFKVLLENENPKGPLLLMLRGAAGSGKTIALKRTAYEAATVSNALVVWLEESGALKPDVFFELRELSDRPIYLFVDQVALQIEKLLPLLKAAKAKSLPLIVVGAERDSDWYTYCGALEQDFTPQFVRVGNLSRGEVEGLLDLLERHGCLGLLQDKSRDEQINAFMEKERADRQLLVALHELTLGKPFEEIVYNEHQRVHPEQARQLYLDIATMHQFSVKVRAGTISRIAGIDFEDYKDRFLGPLQDIVRVEQDKYTGDYTYKTRHSRVAGLVFRQVCADDYAKAKQFKRLICGLDVGYSSDLRALEEITRGRSLAENFTGLTEVREIYKTAVEVAPRQGFLYQQWAIFESMHKDGSLIEAEQLAAVAHDAEPRSKSILHTQAEIDRRRALVEPSPLMKESLRRRARKRLDDMPTGDRFAISSRCKLLVDELSELRGGLSEDTKSYEAVYFAEKVKDTEGALLRAQQAHPDDPDIIQVEARFRKEIDQEDRALKALERAWAAGAKGAGTAIRIAKMYDVRYRTSDAQKVLKEALARNQDDKAAHQAMAIHYLRQPTYEMELVADHLRRSFSAEDQNFEERFNLAQFLFLSGNTPAAVEMFDLIANRAPPSFRKMTPREENLFTEKLPRYSGVVENVRERYIFIRSSYYPRSIFAHRSSSDPDIMDDLSIGQDVNFRIRFNRAGATAVDVQFGRLAAIP
jgi:hypothetical protein